MSETCQLHMHDFKIVQHILQIVQIDRFHATVSMFIVMMSGKLSSVVNHSE